LSVFMTPKKQDRVLDLGCGCGVAGFGLLLANPGKDLHLTGMDNDPEMVECARKNSSKLGLEHESGFLHMDVSRLNSQTLKAESFDLVLMNPPYRRPGSGRTSDDPDRQAATFIPAEQLHDFFRAAAFSLKNRGRAGIVYAASRLDEVLAGLSSKLLRPKKIRLVYGRPGKPARLVLVEVCKQAGPELVIPPPLVLYDEQARLTAQARAFCPFLACNPRRS